MFYEYPHKSIAHEIFRNKVSHAKFKKDEAIVNMVLIVTTKS
jgi:hypothetical protein